jgi:hypothetical protein
MKTAYWSFDMLRSWLNIVVFVAKLSSLRQSENMLVRRRVFVALVAWWLRHKDINDEVHEPGPGK